MYVNNAFGEGVSNKKKNLSLSKLSVLLIHMKSSTVAGIVFGRCQLTLILPSLK